MIPDLYCSQTLMKCCCNKHIWLQCWIWPASIFFEIEWKLNLSSGILERFFLWRSWIKCGGFRELLHCLNRPPQFTKELVTSVSPRRGTLLPRHINTIHFFCCKMALPTGINWKFDSNASIQIYYLRLLNIYWNCRWRGTNTARSQLWNYYLKQYFCIIRKSY